MDLVFGPDGAMYVADFDGLIYPDRVRRLGLSPPEADRSSAIKTALCAV